MSDNDDLPYPRIFVNDYAIEHRILERAFQLYKAAYTKKHGRWDANGLRQADIIARQCIEYPKLDGQTIMELMERQDAGSRGKLDQIHWKQLLSRFWGEVKKDSNGSTAWVGSTD